MNKRKQRGNAQSLVVGLLATAAIVLVYLVGGLDWLELKTLDLRFRHANANRVQDDRLVCIDIDDGALEHVGRWPWSRDIQAGILGVLHEAGLRRLLYDIELTESEPLRSVVARHSDLLANLAALRVNMFTLTLPDIELRTTLQNWGQSYLAFHYQSEELTTPATRELRRRIRDWLAAHPELLSAPPHTYVDRLLADADITPAEHESALVALSFELSLRATLDRARLPLAGVAAAAPPVPALTPIYFAHARAARHCGFVVFDPDLDGVMRRTRLLVEHSGVAVPQLALSVALDELNIPPENISATPRALTLPAPGADEPLVIQLDDQGRAMIPWLAERDWHQQFGAHVPIDAAWVVFDRRLRTRFNREELLSALDTLITRGLMTNWTQFHQDLGRTLELADELHRARWADDADSAEFIARGLDQYENLLAESEPALLSDIETALSSAPTSASSDAAQPATIDVLRIARDALSANRAYREEIESTLSWLRERVADKIGLLGYTASALADMTPIPTHRRAPGVIAHANLLNGLLTGRTVRWVPTWVNALLAALVGLLATWVSSRTGPRLAGIITLLLIAIYALLAGWAAFQMWSVWVALVPAGLTLALGYVVVVVHRHLFLERESRQIARALGQYTSATLARRMAEDAELCKRAEMREVTAIFTDLANFTAISERIGAERTQHVLNVALGRFSDVMLRHEAMINKFIGDGIFAFWNPVIYPQTDHARRACATAVDLQRALDELIRVQATGGDEAFAQLALRVGVATGNAVVGPCGSEQKYDYTCIGDSVNVAARLESANKFFGTCRLVSETTRAQVGDEFAFRPLGGVQVKGKTQAVGVHELLGRAADVPADTLHYADQFAHALDTFQQRNWARALSEFSACAKLRPDDRAATFHIQTAQQYQQTPPPESWTGAIELTEK